jgi:sugar lactone lactonase YvrE
MSIDLKCPQCGGELEVPETAAGTQARCPGCDAAIEVPALVTESAAADVLLADDPDRAVTAAPAGAAVSRTPAPGKKTTRPSRRGRPVESSSLVAPARNGPARVASTCALLSLVPGVALLFGPLAILLGLVGLIVGRARGMARATRDVVAALGFGLITAAGNWGLLLYVVSVLGLPGPIARWYHNMFPPRDVAGVMEDAPDARFKHRPWRDFPHEPDPFGDEDRPNPALRKSLKVSEGGLRAAAFSADGRRAAVRQHDDVELWELETEHHRPLAAGRAEALAFSPDGKWLAVGQSGQADVVRLYDPDTGQCRKTLPADEFAIHKSVVAFSADGKLLAVGCSKGIRLYRTADWEELATGVRQDFISSEAVALSPDGATLAAVVNLPFGGSGTILLWDTRQGKELRRLERHEHFARGLAFAPDGKTLAVAGANLTLLDVAKGTETWAIDHSPFDTALAFSPDGRLIAAGGDRQALVLSLAATGKRLATLKRGLRHGRFVAARFSADGGTLLTASEEGDVETWDVAGLLKQGP